MEKKTYIKPSIKSVCLLIQNLLIQESVKQTSVNSSWASREQQQNRFDWDEENEE